MTELDLPELDMLPEKCRSDKELDRIAREKIKPVMQRRAKALGTDKDVILEKERGRGIPPEYLPKGKLTVEPKKTKRRKEKLDTETQQQVREIDQELRKAGKYHPWL